MPTTGKKIIIKVEKLNKTVLSGGKPLTILDSIDLSIAEGETVAILGVSGSGKTTLLGMLAGLDTPSAGSIVLEQHDISRANEDQRALIRAKKIGFVFQNFQLLPSLTALENVMLPLEINNIKKAKQLAQQWLDKVELRDRSSHYPRHLSGGEQQRVAIARAFAVQPSLLFADEPTGNLDKKTGSHIIELLFNLNIEHNTTLVIVTHDEALAERCQHRLILDGGRLQ